MRKVAFYIMGIVLLVISGCNEDSNGSSTESTWNNANWNGENWK